MAATRKSAIHQPRPLTAPGEAAVFLVGCLARSLPPHRDDGCDEQEAQYSVEHPPLPLGPQQPGEQQPGYAPKRQRHCRCKAEGRTEQKRELDWPVGQGRALVHFDNLKGW